MVDQKNLPPQNVQKFFTSTWFLTNGLWLIGAILFIVGTILAKILFGILPDTFMKILMAISIPWLILGCVFASLRKEIPRNGLPSIKGRLALFQGILGILFFGALELYVLYLLVRQILAK